MVAGSWRGIMGAPFVVHIGPSERFVRAVFGIKVDNRQFS